MMRNNSIFTIHSNSTSPYYYKTFQATYFQPIDLQTRHLFEMSMEGKFYLLRSEEDVDKYFLSDIYLNDDTWEIIFILKNQLLADNLLKGYRYSHKNNMFRGLLINADFENTYKVSDFLNDYDPNYNKPYFFILEKEFEEIYDVLSKNSYLLCSSTYDNYNSFFPKNYLLILNYLLLIVLIGISSIWIYLSFVYKDHFSDLHRWFTGILLLKLLYTFLIIKCLYLNYHRAESQREELFNDFKMIFFDTLLSAMNVLFKSFFLFIFLLIFEVTFLNIQ